MLMNIIIATAILWALSACLVLPLANAWLASRLQEPAYAHLNRDNLSEQEQADLHGLATTTYILSDVLVLGLAGLIGGLLGYWFIGMSFETRGWPGMLAFIGASFFGVNLIGG